MPNFALPEMARPLPLAHGNPMSEPILKGSATVGDTAPNGPLVAVIFATYNNAATAAGCLKSCLGQSYTSLAVIAADDGSTDNTPDALCAAAGGDSRFQLLRLPHGERGAARAAATKAAREAGADFLYIIDSDMMLKPGLIESCVTFLNSHQSVGALAIPEIPFSQHRNFMSRVKVFERRVMNNAGEKLGANSIEAARFWRLGAYDSTGGINAGQIAFEETQPTIRYLEKGGQIRRATFTGVRHDEKRVTFGNLLAKKRYYFSVMDKTITTEEGGIWKAVTRSYFFRPVLYRPSNVALYAQSPLLASGMFGMYLVLSAVAAVDVLKGLRRKAK